MDKQKQIESMVLAVYPWMMKVSNEERKDLIKHITCLPALEKLYKAGWRKIPENAVVIDRNENPCLSCPVPEDIQRDVDCSTICGAVRLGIDWQNQCKVLVKENKQLTKALAEKGKETAEKFAERLKEALENRSAIDGYDLEDLEFDGEIIQECIDEIAKEIIGERE